MPPAVRRRRFAVPVLLALSGLGWAAAHAVAHKAVMADAAMPAPVLDRYLEYLATSVALCLALALPLAAGALVGQRWKGASLRSLWLFGFVPVLGFLAHTATEPLVSGAGTGTSFASLAPIALVGLLVQIPFALVAVGFARHVLWLAERLARLEVAPARTAALAAIPGYPRPRASRAPAFRLDHAHTERGPPLLTA
jgi:hypothetical protein